MAPHTGSKYNTYVTTRSYKRPVPLSLSITIIGAGAVGSHFAARLWEAGHAVNFYVQGDYYKVTKPPSVVRVGDKRTLKAPIDWVIITLKSTSLASIPDLIFHMLTPNTRVLVIMNGLRIEDDLIRMIKRRAGETDSDEDAPLKCCRAIYGGLAVLCSSNAAKTDHSYGGMLAAGLASSRINIPGQDKYAFEQLWAQTTVEAIYEPCLLRGRWTKMVGNIPTSGITLAMGGITVDNIVSDPDLRRLANKVMDETIAVANADLERKYGSGNFVPLGEAEKARVWHVCRVSTASRHTGT
jgi:2-dehydropantoate 2-reductase